MIRLYDLYTVYIGVMVLYVKFFACMYVILVLLRILGCRERRRDLLLSFFVYFFSTVLSVHPFLYVNNRNIVQALRCCMMHSDVWRCIPARLYVRVVLYRTNTLPLRDVRNIILQGI